MQPFDGVKDPDKTENCEQTGDILQTGIVRAVRSMYVITCSSADLTAFAPVKTSQVTASPSDGCLVDTDAGSSLVDHLRASASVHHRRRIGYGDREERNKHN